MVVLRVVIYLFNNVQKQYGIFIYKYIAQFNVAKVKKLKVIMLGQCRLIELNT